MLLLWRGFLGKSKEGVNRIGCKINKAAVKWEKRAFTAALRCGIY